MGQSNVTCLLTGLPITSYRDDAALVPLMFNPDYRCPTRRLEFDKGQTSLGSNDYERTLFNPLAFPIRGQYDDYGGIKRIQENEHTRLIERCTDLSIQEFCDAITSRASDETPGFLRRVHGVWLHGEIWDHFVNLARHWKRRSDESDYQIRRRMLDYLGVSHERKRILCLASCPDDIIEEASWHCLLPFEQKQLTEYYIEHLNENPGGDLDLISRAFSGVSASLIASGRYWIPTGATFQDGEFGEYLIAQEKAVEIARRYRLEELKEEQ